MTEKWNPADATTNIRKMSVDPEFSLYLKIHAAEQMADRRIIMSDVLYILKNGFVYKDPIPATQTDLFRYAIESKSPNSQGRSIRLIIIAENMEVCMIKLCTVMWVDEIETRTGSITEEKT